jgi:type I restriction enzyme, S subunit
MNAEHLPEAFNRLGDEPETVQQFRKLVIGLAMSGKLVAPDEPVIDPASLLTQIEAKKRVLIQRGVVRKQNPFPALLHEDLPRGFNNPANFVRLGSIARIEKGLTGIMKAAPGPYPLVVTAEDRASCNHFDFDGAAAIVPLVSSAGHGKASLQRLHYQEGKFALGSILAAVFPHAPELISARFLFEYLTSFKEELLVSQMIGTANVSLSVGKFSDVPVPLVPPSVQRKVDELMVLCDRLETARAEREATRDRLTAASLARLNTPDSDTFHDDARFALDALPAITARPDQIKLLRQTILNLAVCGKLVLQDPKDEPASELLKRLQKARVVAHSREQLRARPPITKLSREDLTFDIPNSWELPSFDDLFIIVSGVTKGQKIPASESIDIPYLRVANVQRGYLDLAVIKTITVRTSDTGRFALQLGDILMTEGGDWDKLGRAAIWREEIKGCIHQNHVFRVRPPSNEILPEWVISYVNSLLGRAFFEEASKQTTNLASINMTQLRGCPIPLPPLAEQHRIVAKVGALMVLCDRLEASLTTGDETRRLLLDALLHEALAPVDDREMESAE